MILKYKYHSDSGLLEAYRSYTLAQNNSLSDTIVITSTAPDAERYNYCLEFICYNSKSIPKAQYISPILNYSDGISLPCPTISRSLEVTWICNSPATIPTIIL